jgi:4a-hydroxytetrahydrobiopterin dehydratase
MEKPLYEIKCVPCEGGVPPLTREEAKVYAAKIDPAWHFTGDKEIFREFVFRDFKEAMTFLNRVAEIAEEEGHHPDMQLAYNKMRLALTTHAIKGLSENDFVMAAKIDRIPLNPD